MAWEDMRRRLEDDDHNPVVPPPVNRGCGRYALLLVVLVVAVFFIVDPFKWIHQKANTKAVQTPVEKNENGQIADSLSPGKTGIQKNEEIIDSLNLDKTSQNGNTETTDPVLLDTINQQNTATGRMISKDSSNASSGTSDNNKLKQSLAPPGPVKKLKTAYRVNSQVQAGIPAENTGKGFALRKNGKALVDINSQDASDAIQKQKKLTGNTNGKLTTTISGASEDSLNIELPILPATRNHSENIDKDTSNTIIVVTKPATDSVKNKMPDTTIISKKGTPDSSEKRKIYFSAGLAIHQLLPIAGQKTSPYSSTGRSGSLADYIPSIYLRMYREKKWFIQTEFRYGAPQYNKELVFNDRVIDSGGATVSASRSSVKKTFYNQLPVSFNYFVLPNLSLGAGLTFNKFKAALVQRDFHITNVFTQKDTVLATELFSQKGADSNFVTTYFQGLVELQYQWKRLSFGARYSFGIQPYIKFKLPDGQESSERNTALQLFIRYELWRSKK